MYESATLICPSDRDTGLPGIVYGRPETLADRYRFVIIDDEAIEQCIAEPAILATVTLPKQMPPDTIRRWTLSKPPVLMRHLPEDYPRQLARLDSTFDTEWGLGVACVGDTERS